MLFARYAAKLAIFYPFALLCYLPLSGFLRLPLKKLAALGALGVTAFVGIGALACCRFQLSVSALLFPALLLFLLSHLYPGTTGKTVGQMFKMMITGWHEH